jgi:hypothetical protein
MDENIIFDLTHYGTAIYSAITGDQNPLVMGYQVTGKVLAGVKRFA